MATQEQLDLAASAANGSSNIEPSYTDFGSLIGRTGSSAGSPPTAITSEQLAESSTNVPYSEYINDPVSYNKKIAALNNQARFDSSSNNSSSPTTSRDLDNAASALEQRYREVDFKNYFNPYRLRQNVEPYIGGKPMIFMTTPQMNIFGDSDDSTSLTATGSSENQTSSNIQPRLAKASSIFTYYNETDKDLVKALTYNGMGTPSVWIKFLTNQFKGLTLKDLTAKTTEEYETYYGWKQILPGPNVDSYSADTLSVNFTETKNLDVIKYHYMWMEYIEAVRYGIHVPTQAMRTRRTIDYTSSLYYFVLDDDLSTILYYCKYVGIYPTSVPLSILATGDISSRQPVDATINYAYQYKEELRPTVIMDFNAVATKAARINSYRRSANGTTTYDGADAIASAYGYGDIDSYVNTPIDFLNERQFGSVKITTMSVSDYKNGQNVSLGASTKDYKSVFKLQFLNPYSG